MSDSILFPSLKYLFLIHLANIFEHSRLLIAQDRQEIYVIVATYDKDYFSYLKGKHRQGQAAHKKSFLMMEEYGPFNVEKRSQMDMLGKIMLAVTMAAQ